MLGNRYTFTEPGSCCCSCCDKTTGIPKCPGWCGIYTVVYPWFSISGNGVTQKREETQKKGEEGSTSFLGFLSSSKEPEDEMRYRRNIPYFCCRYIGCLSCDEAEISLHNKYTIISPFFGCRESRTITNLG